jgi:heat-inducible transcriptional repressor
VDRDRYLTVFVAEPGVVKYAHAVGPGPVRPEWLRALSELLNDVAGLNPAERWNRAIAQRAKAVFTDLDARTWARQMLRELFEPAEGGGFFFDGASHLYSSADLRGKPVEAMSAFLGDRAALASMLAGELFGDDESLRPGSVAIRIGAENRAAPLLYFSEVFAPYVVNGRAAGAVGVVGPRRMEYGRAAQVVSDTAKALQDLFSNRSVGNGHEIGWPVSNPARAWARWRG